MEKEIKQCLTDIRDFCSAVLEYFSLKNQVLWESTSDWTSGSKTINNLEKYKTFRIYPYATLTGVLCEWDISVIRGANIIEEASATTTVNVAFEYALTVSGYTATISKAQYVMHNGSSQPSGTCAIRKIVGVEPAIPDALKKYIGGGYCIRKIGGALYEITHHLKGYIKCIKDTAKQKEPVLLQKCNCGESIWKDYNSVQYYASDNRNISDSWRRSVKHKFIEHMYGEYNGRSKLYKSMRSAWSKHDEFRWRNSCLYARRGNGVKWCRKPNIIRVPKFNLQSLWEVNSNKAGKITPRGGVCYG